MFSVNDHIRLLASFVMAYAMENLGWKFYFINASWDLIFLVIAYFIFVETKGLKLEEIAAKFEGSRILEALSDDDSAPEKTFGDMDKSGHELRAKSREVTE